MTSDHLFGVRSTEGFNDDLM